MQILIEGRTTVMDGGSPNSGQSSLRNSDTDNDPREDYRGERELAAAVFRQAFLDLGVRVDGQRGRRGDSAEHEHERSTARLFLFDAAWAPMREHWLALLGMTDPDWMALIHKETHQGHRNRVLEALGEQRLFCGGQRAGKAFPREGDSGERQNTHWEGCGASGDPRHAGCA